jgi:hypothetical protein
VDPHSQQLHHLFAFLGRVNQSILGIAVEHVERVEDQGYDHVRGQPVADEPPAEPLPFEF